jgi:predicted nucleotidyltransferase component of viral defense system
MKNNKGLGSSQEKVLTNTFYKFAAYCHDNGVQVMFKGGCLMQHILRSHGQLDIRKTKDIDFDIALDSYDRLIGLTADLLRFGKLRGDWKLNAHFIKEKIDCDIAIIEQINPLAYMTYSGPYGVFIGAVIEDILADKIQSTSGNHIIARAKDVYDIYRIATLKGSVGDISLIRSFLGQRAIGDFKIYTSRDKRLMDNLRTFHKEPDKICQVVDSFVFPLVSNQAPIKWTGSMWM